MLVIFSGSSGVGKNTIINELLKEDYKYELLPTYTTREMRDNEENGKPYYFITDVEFLKKLEENEFYEHEVVHEHYYGTSRKVLSEKKKSDKILLKDIDVKGTERLVNVINSDIKLITFFLYVEDKKILVKRLIERGEKNIDLRLSRYDMEMKYANKYSYIINNYDMYNTISIVKSLINLENSNKILFPTQNFRDISMDKVYSIAKSMESDEEIIPINIMSNNEQWYIIDGHHRYLASVMTKKVIAKKVIENAIIDKVEYDSWEDLLKAYAIRKEGN